jgi:ATP-dependent helicase HepA
MENITGRFIIAPNNMGIGKVINQFEDMITVEYFISIENRKRLTIRLSQLQLVKPDIQTRCYYWESNKSQWMIGRITGFDGTDYQVDFPDSYSNYIDSENLFVRCSLPIEDPMEILINKGHETAFFNLKRTLFVKEMMNQRKVGRGMEGLLSSSVSLYPHQVEVIRRVLEDPVPRYLLADEVGLGKTIEAGVIIRQFLLDYPNSSILILVPLFLQIQWQSELHSKCNLYEFSDQITWCSTESLSSSSILLQEKDWDLVVIDEAHIIAAKASSSIEKERELYHLVEKLTNQARGLLLLSATPVLHNEQDFLAMLHLLDPDHYHLDEIERFQKLISIRQHVGRILFTLRENAKPLLLRRSAEKLLGLVSDDGLMISNVQYLLDVLDENDEEKRIRAVRTIRNHLTETYRLHRRMLRNRRDIVKQLFKYGRELERGELSVSEEYDFDNRTASVQDLMDEWRETAWALERDEWQEFGFSHSTNYQRLFFHLLELSNSALPVFRHVLEARLSGDISDSFKELYNTEFYELLREVPLFSGERELLESMIYTVSISSEEEDRLEHLIMVIDTVTEQTRKRKKTSPKIVVFAGHYATANFIVNHLRSVYKTEAIASYLKTLSYVQVEQEIEHFRSNEHCCVLVCDPSGELGRNLQFADTIIHFDLLTQPGRMEQRIGRVDRLGRKRTFSTHVFTGPDHPSLIEAWYIFLNEGLKVFQNSISSLQFLIDGILPEIYGRFYAEGAQSFIRYVRESFADRLEEEKIKVEEQNALDEMDSSYDDVHGYVQNLVAYESDHARIRKNTEAWILNALKFSFKSSSKAQLGELTYSPTRQTLLPISTSIAMAKINSRYGSYDRVTATSQENCRIYRIGDPFIQMLDDDIKWDDRGRTFAFWRKVKGWNPKKGFEWFGFSFNYIIEGNVSAAETIYSSIDGKAFNRKALQRKMDSFFPPFIYTVNVTPSGSLVTDSNVIEALKAPFEKLSDYGNDTNLTKEKINVIDEFISPDQWHTSCICARKSSELLLMQDASVVTACEEALQSMRQELNRQFQQLALRAKMQQTHGHFDPIDLAFESDLHQAMQAGIKKPHVRLDSVGFIILSGSELREDYNE